MEVIHLTEIEKLKKYIIELEQTIINLKSELRNTNWENIYNFFNDNGIKLTAEKFNMTIKEVMDFIIDCDNNTDGLQSASDYRECHIKEYGKDSDDDQYDEQDDEKDY